MIDHVFQADGPARLHREKLWRKAERQDPVVTLVVPATEVRMLADAYERSAEQLEARMETLRGDPGFAITYAEHEENARRLRTRGAELEARADAVVAATYLRMFADEEA